MLVFLKAPFFVLYFSYYTLMKFLMMLSVILLSVLMILLSNISVIKHLIVATTGIGQGPRTGAGSAFLILMLEKLKLV